jgi:hypothetical protein
MITPELDKLLEVRDESHSIAKFIEFLKSRGYNMSFDLSNELALYFGLDRVKIELERGKLWAAIKELPQ